MTTGTILRFLIRKRCKYSPARVVLYITADLDNYRCAAETAAAIARAATLLLPLPVAGSRRNPFGRATRTKNP